MKSRTMTWLLAFSFGLNLVFLASAALLLYRISRPPEVHKAVSHPSSPYAHLLEFDEVRLKLTPEQRQKFRLIREHWEMADREDRAQAMERINRLGGLLVREDITTQTLHPLLKEVRRHSDDFFVRLGRAIGDSRGVLTPEQNKIFTRMLQERYERFKGMMHHRAAHHH